MAIIAYKAFKKGLIATHGNGEYQFIEGINTTEKAQCASCGFHCAEDPLDMFNYYPCNKSTEYRIVIASGDIHEDGGDSRIACTRMIVKKELTIEQVAAAALLYYKKHPERSREEFIKENYFRMKRATDPVLCGKKGEWLCFAKGSIKEISRINMFLIDGEKFKADTKYDIDGNERK